MTTQKKANDSMTKTALILAGLLALASAALTGCPQSEEAVPPQEEVTLSCGQAALFSFTHDQCAPMDAVGDGACRCAIGFAWDGAACVGVGGCECRGADCDSLTETIEECVENHASCVEPPSLECGSEALFSQPHDRCEPMDAIGEGGCRCVLGYVWDGADCTMIGGCECQGEDCEGLTQSYEECLASHESCRPEPARTPCGEELECDAATELCVVYNSRRPEHRCVPVPAGCADDRSCGCAGEELCSGGFELCADDPAANTLTCECPTC